MLAQGISCKIYNVVETGSWNDKAGEMREEDGGYCACGKMEIGRFLRETTSIYFHYFE